MARDILVVVVVVASIVAYVWALGKFDESLHDHLPKWVHDPGRTVQSIWRELHGGA